MGRPPRVQVEAKYAAILEHGISIVLVCDMNVEVR